MLHEHEIRFKGWDELKHDHTKYVRKESNARQLQDTREYLVAMVNDFIPLNEETIEDTIYPPPQIFNKGIYVEFSFKFEFDTIIPSVVYKGCHVSKE